jgi:hypothetical protein
MSKRDGALLVGVGVWNIAIWGNFARNLVRTKRSGADRPTAYYVAHAALIGIDTAIGGVLLAKGARALRG